MSERYKNQPSNAAPDIRYINALTDHIRLKARESEGWAKNAWSRKMVGRMILTSQLEAAAQSILQPLDFEPENVMLDGEPADPVWPDVDEEGEGGIAT